jgi:hypothetical protein
MLRGTEWTMGVVWSPAFQHQFLDANPRNFNAWPGTHHVAPPVLVVPPTPPRDQLGFAVRPGHRFEYVFNPPLVDVIGADIKLVLAFPPGSTTVQLSGQVVLANGAIRLLVGFVNGVARLQLFVHTDVIGISVPFADSAPLRVHARWHTHGQGQVWVNGTLRAYDPSLAPTASFTVNHLRFGHPADQVVANAPAFLIRNITVKLLRRNDPGRILDSLFPIPEPSPLDEACRRKLASVDAAILEEIRSFMRSAIGRLTSRWQEGMPGGPFTPAAVATHDAAGAASLAFMAFLVHRRDQDAERVKEKVTEFLTIIRATDPTGYAQLVGRLEAMTGEYDPACLARLQPLAQQHAAALQPVKSLLETILGVIRSPGGPP